MGIKLKFKIRCAEIRQQTKLKDVIQVSSKLKWCWAGYLARDENGKWSKITTEWIPPEGRRRRARQKRRWVDSIIKHAGHLWKA